MKLHWDKKAEKLLVDSIKRYAMYYGKKLRRQKGEAPPLAKGSFDYGKGTPSDHFTLGFGKAKMTLPDIETKTYYMAGYGTNKPATGVLDPLFAHAVWLDDNTGRGGILLVSLDFVGMLNKDINAMRQSLSGFVRMTGCRGIHICSTHNHAGPDTMGISGKLPKSGKDKGFMHIVYAAVRVAAQLAYRERKDGALFFGQCEIADLQKDIRDPSVFSKAMTRLRFVPKDGSRETYLINFAAHAEMLDYDNTLISPDYPCYLRNRVREKTGAETIFFQGAIGGMVTLVDQDKNPIKSTFILGEKLGDAAVAITDERELHPNISTLRQEVYFPAQNLILFLAGRLGLLNVDVYARPDAFYGLSLKSELNYIEIDGLQCLLLPGELFPELLLGGYLSAERSGTGLGAEANPRPLAEIAQDEKLLVFGLANDELGYILPPNDFCLHPVYPFLEDLPQDRVGKKHYEETNSLGIATAPTLAETFTQMMETVRQTKGVVK